ncbi:MAG: glutathione peroxidase [Chitinophagales bacterium]|nr:glutathione peroxidase [Chitinophagales bacterium]
MKNSIYRYKIKTAKGSEIDWSQFEGKVLLIVNTASECGFTPQFKALTELYHQYRNRGFEIIGTPCNEFAGQEPNSSEGAMEFCKSKYGVDFTITEKIHVKKGVKQHELFQFLTNKNINGKVNKAPIWNFQKYLIDKNGGVIDYFLPITAPGSNRIKRAIEKSLDQ